MDLDLARKHHPTGRPLAEPPIFKYDDFVYSHRDNIPSDARLKRLFSKNIELRWQWRDKETDSLLFHVYSNWFRDLDKKEKSPE